MTTARSIHALLVVLLLVLSHVSTIAQAPVTSDDQSPPLTRPGEIPARPGETRGTPADHTQPSAAPPGDARPQARPRGNGSLFGGSDSASTARSQAVDLTVSVSSAYDDDLSEGQNVGSQLLSPMGGQFSDVNGALTLARKGSKVEVAARASSSLRHYPALNSFVGSTHSGGADLAIDVNRRTILRANLEGSYVSTFALDTLSRQAGLNPGGASTPDFANTALDWTRMSYGGAVALSRTVGRHSFLAVNSGIRMSERSLLAERADVRSIGAQYGHALGRDTSLWIEYNMRSGTQEFSGEPHPVTSHDGQVGFQRRWRHSTIRRTVLSLAGGPSVLHEGQGITRQIDQSRVVPLVGMVTLNHEMSRSWSLGVSYRRAAGFIDAGLSNTATFDLRGLLTPRLELVGSAGYSDVDLGRDAHQNQYGTTLASSRLQYALTRTLAFYGQYSLYRYHFGSGVPLAANVPLQLQRRGVRAGLTVWLPLHQTR